MATTANDRRPLPEDSTAEELDALCQFLNATDEKLAIVVLAAYDQEQEWIQGLAIATELREKLLAEDNTDRAHLQELAMELFAAAIPPDTLRGPQNITRAIELVREAGRRLGDGTFDDGNWYSSEDALCFADLMNYPARFFTPLSIAGLVEDPTLGLIAQAARGLRHVVHERARLLRCPVPYRRGPKRGGTCGRYYIPDPRRPGHKPVNWCGEACEARQRAQELFALTSGIIR